MRIKKTSQYIEGGASLSNVYGTSDENGYTQEYLNGAIPVIDNGEEPFTTIAGYVDATITFNKTFTSPPVVMLSLISDTTNTNYKEMAYMVRTNTITTTGFQIRVISSQANLYPRISWVAIGK